MPGLIELLESFNRKERFFLISQAVGEFQLSDNFGRELAKAIKVDVPHGCVHRNGLPSGMADCRATRIRVRRCGQNL